MKINRIAQISAPKAEAALIADTSNAAPNWPRRIVVIIIAWPLVNLGYALAWPGLKLSIIGHAIITAMLKPPTFRKN